MPQVPTATENAAARGGRSIHLRSPRPLSEVGGQGGTSGQAQQGRGPPDATCRRLRPTARQDPGPAVPVAMCSRGSGAAAARVGVPQSSVRVTPQPVHVHLPAGAPRAAHAGVQTELLAAAELGAAQECPQGWLPVTDTRASQREELQVTQGPEDRSPGDSWRSQPEGGAMGHSGHGGQVPR